MEVVKTIQGTLFAVCAMGSAGAIDFTGVSLSLGGSFVHGISSAHTDATDHAMPREVGAMHRTIGGTYTTYNLDLVKKNRVLPTLGVSYRFPAFTNSDFQFAISGLWDVGPYNQRFVSTTQQFYRAAHKRTPLQNLTNYQMETRLHGREHLALSLEPGYAFSKQTVGYLKLSYHYLRSALASTSTHDEVTDPYVETAPTPKANFNGIGIGVGVKQYIGMHWFLGADIESVRYQTLERAAPVFNEAGGPAELFQMQSITPKVVATRAIIGYQF